MDNRIRGMADGYFRLFVMIRGRYKMGDEAALGVLQEVAKDIRVERMRHGQGLWEADVLGPDLATERQLRFLERLGVQPQEGLTKTEASQLIDQGLLQEKGAGGMARAADEEIGVEVIKM